MGVSSSSSSLTLVPPSSLSTETNPLTLSFLDHNGLLLFSSTNFANGFVGGVGSSVLIRLWVVVVVVGR